jgi:ABC-2 type transport system ATP-binding protein
VDTPENLRKQLYGRKVVIHLKEIHPEWKDLLSTLPFVQGVETDESRLLIKLDKPEEQNPVIITKLVEAGAQIQFVGELRHSLEEVYLQMIHENGQGKAL